MGFASLATQLFLVLGLDEALGSPLKRASNTWVDVCANIKRDLNVPDYSHPGGFITVGPIDACLCLSSLSSFVGSNPVAIAGAKLVGSAEVTVIIDGLIQNDPNHMNCNLPDYAAPQCMPSNPCNFTCTSGFTYRASNASISAQCMCEPPATVCNGQCGNFAACPSASAIVKREISHRRSASRCRNGKSACAVFYSSGRMWDCVDTTSDLENCGGCTFMNIENPSARVGADCTTLPGVSDVACINGRCAIQRCDPGYELSWDGAVCLRSGSGFVIGLDD